MFLFKDLLAKKTCFLLFLLFIMLKDCPREEALQDRPRREVRAESQEEVRGSPRGKVHNGVRSIKISCLDELIQLFHMQMRMKLPVF